MLPGGALVNTLHKDVVQLLSHGDLSMLQLGQGVNHHGVLEVLLHHALKHMKIIGRELGDTLIESPRDLRISGCAPRYHILNVLLALLHVEAELLKVPDHQLLI